MRVHIDVYDGAKLTKDDVGFEVEDVEDAYKQAAKTIQEIAGDEPLGRERRQLAAVVRDTKGVELYRAELSFEGHTADD